MLQSNFITNGGNLTLPPTLEELIIHLNPKYCLEILSIENWPPLKTLLFECFSDDWPEEPFHCERLFDDIPTLMDVTLWGIRNGTWVRSADGPVIKTE